MKYLLNNFSHYSRLPKHGEKVPEGRMRGSQASYLMLLSTSVLELLISILLLGVACNVSAEEIFPKGCTPLVVKGDSVNLSVSTPTVVMMHNLSKTELWITHPVEQPSASAGWTSRLQAGNWSALAIQRKTFVLNCIESKPGHEQQISCAEVLAVCQWTNVSMPEQMSGTFWAGEDRLLSPLIAYIERRGFELRTPTQRPKNNGE